MSSRIAPAGLLLAALSLLAAACDDKPQAGQAAGSASAVAAGPLPSRHVQLRTRPVRAGQKWKTERTSTLKVEVEFWSEGNRLGTSEKIRKEEAAQTVEVLGLVGVFPGKVQVKYERYLLETDEPDAPPRTDSSLSGRTFVLDVTGNEVAVTEAGKPVTNTEKSTLVTHFASLGKADPATEAMGTRPIEVDKTLPLRASLFKALLGSSDGEFKGGKIRIAPPQSREGGEIVPLEWTAQLQTQEAGMVSTFDIKGKTEISTALGREVRHDVTGAIDITGRKKHEGAWVRLEGNGSYEDRLVTTMIE